MKYTKILSIALILASIIFILDGTYSEAKTLKKAKKVTKKTAIKKSPPKQPAPIPASTDSYTLKCPQGNTVLSATKSAHNITTKSYMGLGEYVQSINSKSENSKYFWALYINNKKSQKGASSYTCGSNDTLTWKYERIQ